MDAGDIRLGETRKPGRPSRLNAPPEFCPTGSGDIRASRVGTMRVGLGLVLPIWERPPAGPAPSWSETREMAGRAKSLGADTAHI